MTQNVPPDFSPLPSYDSIMSFLSPLFYRRQGDELHIGFHAASAHLNARGALHGGIWATLADIQIGLNLGTMIGRTGPTIRLNLDYLAPARSGEWLVGRTRLIHRTDKVAFADCTFRSKDELKLRADAAFRLVSDPIDRL